MNPIGNQLMEAIYNKNEVLDIKLVKKDTHVNTRNHKEQLDKAKQIVCKGSRVTISIYFLGLVCLFPSCSSTFNYP